MKARVLFEDTNRVHHERVKFEKAEAELNQLNDFLKDHKLETLTYAMARKFMKNSKEALRDIYKEKIPAINEYTGLPNDKNAMISQMQLPAPPSDDSFVFARLLEGGLSVFDFNMKVSINSDRLQDYLNAFRFITTDPKIIEVYEDFKVLAKQLDKINNSLHFIPAPVEGSASYDYKLGEVIALTSRGFEIQQKGFMIATHLMRRG